MATDPAPAQPASSRPRPSLLVMLGLVVVAVLAYWLWPSASSIAPPSNQQRLARGQAGQKSGADAASLDVRLRALKTPPPEPTEAERNPFRFQPKPPPPPPSPPTGSGRAGEGGLPVQPIGPPPVPPIPLKFIGTLEGRGPGKVAIFSDNRGLPVYGHEGEIILGQYRIVRIGVESVVMEYLDGRGRQTIPLRGP